MQIVSAHVLPCAALGSLLRKLVNSPPEKAGRKLVERAASGIKLLMKLEPEQTNHMQALRVNHVVRPTCPNNVKTTETMDTMRTWDLAKNPNGTVRVISVVISGCLQRKMVTAEALWILGGPSW
ncbi:hypothetical protein BM1_05517 [Bipolaris maydis]|nr:hypothetical protein BM1_05517 [Bipolaris maydis]